MLGCESSRVFIDCTGMATRQLEYCMFESQQFFQELPAPSLNVTIANTQNVFPSIVSHIRVSDQLRHKWMR